MELSLLLCFVGCAWIFLRRCAWLVLLLPLSFLHVHDRPSLCWIDTTQRNAHNGSKPNSTEPTDQPMIMINTVDLLQTTARSTTPRRPIGTIRSLSARATRREKKRTAHCRKRKSTRTSTVEKSGTLPTTANVSESPLSGTAG